MSVSVCIDIDAHYDFLEREQERREERMLASRPLCSSCGEHIQEEYACEIAGKLYCDSCIEASQKYIPYEWD